MEMIPWWNLLQRPVDPQQQQYNALLMQQQRMKMQEAAREMQARNALAQAIGGGATGNALLGPLAQIDPSAAIRLSMDERQRNAMLSGLGGGVAGGPATGDAAGGIPAGSATPAAPGAVTQFNPQAYLQAGGEPSKVPAMMSAEARAAKERADASLANQKLIDEQLHKATLHLYDELKPEYDQNVEKFGQKRAEEIYLEHRAKLIPQMKASSDYAAIADRLQVSAPFSVLERNALGVKELRERQKDQDQANKAAAQLKLKQADLKVNFGTAPDGSQVAFRYGPDGPIDMYNIPIDTSKLKDIHREPTGVPAYSLSDDSAEMLARQRMAGDASALQGLGYGSAGAANRGKVIEAMRRLGATGEQLAAARSEFSAATAAAQTAGRRAANIDTAINELTVFIPRAKLSSEKVNRTQYPTLNSVIQAYDRGTGDENVVRMAVDTNEVLNAYSQVGARGGQPTDEVRRQGMTILNNAYSKGQYATALDEMNDLAKVAKTAPEATIKEISDRLIRRFSDQSSAPPSAPSTPAAPAASPAAPQPEVPFRGGEAAPAPGTAKSAAPSVPQTNGVYTLRKGQEEADYDALPHGTVFTGPDGVQRRKP